MAEKYFPLDKKKLDELTSRFPTPFYLYDERGIRENARRLKKAFGILPGFTEFFAVKGLPNPFILKILADEGFGTGVRRIDVEPDRDVIFFSYGFEGEADTLLDGIIAGAFAVGRVELGIVSAAVVDICVFKQFAFVLPDPVRSLYEIVVSDGFYPRDEGAIVISVVVIPYALVDNTGRVGEKQISGGGMVLSVSV